MPPTRFQRLIKAIMDAAHVSVIVLFVLFAALIVALSWVVVYVGMGRLQG